MKSLISLFSSPSKIGFNKQVFASQNILLKTYLHNIETSNRKCWNCQEHLCKCMFLCKCGKIQKPSGQCTYFEMFGISENDFELDLNFIKQRWTRLQQDLHPDKYSNLSEFEKQLSAESSSIVNEAYKTLKYPLSRAIYTLHLKGYDLNEKDIAVESEFLMEVMEYNERINEIQSSRDKENLENEINAKYLEILSSISRLINSSDYEKAFQHLKHLTYFDNIRNKL